MFSDSGSDCSMFSDSVLIRAAFADFFFFVSFFLATFFSSILDLFEAGSTGAAFFLM
jgi:hypothetical protein